MHERFIKGLCWYSRTTNKEHPGGQRSYSSFEFVHVDFEWTINGVTSDRRHMQALHLLQWHDLYKGQSLE